MSKLCRIGLLMIMIMILHHSNLRMLEICGKICRMWHMQHICAAYFAKLSIFFHIFCLQKFRIF